MKAILAHLVAALAMFLWGFVFWGLAADWIGMTQLADDQAAFGSALQQHLSADGAYVLPGYGSDEHQFRTLHEAGPIAFVHYRRAGAPVMAGGVFAGGFLHMLVSCVLLGALLRPLAREKRAGVLLLTALVCAVFANLGEPIWWYQSWKFHTLAAFYDLAALLLAGSILTKMLPDARPAGRTSPEAAAEGAPA